MGRRTLAGLFAVAVLVFAGAAAGDPGSEKSRVDGRIGELTEQAEAQRQEAGVLTEELSAVAGRVRDLEAGVDAQQARLGVLESEVSRIRSRLDVLDTKLAEQTRDLRRLRREHALAIAALERHVRAIYVSDDPDLVAVLLGATSFSELVDSVDLMRRLGRQDRRIAQRVGAARDAVAKARAKTRAARVEVAALERVAAARAAEQRAVVDRLEASRDALVTAQATRRTTLARIQGSREELLAEIESLEVESARLAAVIRAAQAASSSTAAAPPVTGNGTLGWPVSGTVTSGFGPRWGRMHEGIDIAVPTGTPVRAAGAGTVISVGWQGGYGNLVVIDHGGGLATAYAHNSALLVAVGQQVATGQTVASSGNTGNSSGPHVHFEVRVNGVAADPLAYL
jgi:murein DD-endopeptidase MepM/ murein hydrolase activator NlpD